MNKLPLQTRTQILSMLCEGSSLRSISRVCDVSVNTVSKLLADAGKACAAFHDEKVRGVKARRVQVDEIWSFTCAKQKNVMTAKAVPTEAGDTWTWTAIEADTKLLITWLVGGRDSDYAIAFMDDLRDRLGNRTHLTSDGHKAYLEAVEGTFDANVDDAQLAKLYGNAPEGTKGRTSPAECAGITSHVERPNLTMRMHVRRLPRLTNGTSKKFENHMHMVALYTVWYNYVKQHKSLKGLSPAMAAGLSETLWSMTDVTEMVDAAQPKPGKRGPYKKTAEEISN
ncbi:MAG: IS1 family transposase [Alphaproteobacteria bacterium]|nr:IS1 family transposase [Alphaproteobacteria bacterium]